MLTRNYALEDLAIQYLERCGNVDVGCNFKRTNVQDIEEHMEVCSYRWVYRTLTSRPKRPISQISAHKYVCCYNRWVEHI
jgi:hypothetical protein